MNQSAESAAEEYANKFVAVPKRELTTWQEEIKGHFLAGVQWRDKNPSDEVRALLLEADKVIGQLCANGNLARSIGVDFKLLNETCVKLENIGRQKIGAGK